MSNQEGKPEFVFKLATSALYDLMQAQISMVRTQLDLYESQAGEVTDETASRKLRVSSATKEREEQTCSDQEKASNSDLEMNRLKEQLQQRDNEIHPQSEDSSEIKESQAETKIPEMQTKLDKQRKELVEAETETQEVATPESSSSDCLSGEKLCVNKVIELVVSQAIEKVSTKYKLFTERLTPDCISDRLIEKIWPEIELKHLDLSPKWLKNIDKAILKDLCKTHNCKEKYLIFNLREQLDNITVPTFTKHLLALPRRVLSVSKNRDEYQEAVKNVTKDLVMHAMNGEDETATWNAGTSEFIIQRLSHKIWNKILSKNYKMSLENIEQLGLKVSNELRERWPSPILLMRSSNPVVDEAVVSSFKKHAKLRSQNVIFRAFSCAR
ncbi:unnamed protein product [Oreochromis niloticus]|nr:unnamed protein product [Mustela putorius furo]CAI5690803.1 unnamed protein product [Mustela putorius furo]CAI5690804.1 unnamed protein product [Mustela putorius furo]CAI5690805.1 unnamed protein product [Mustela putorius furo]